MLPLLSSIHHFSFMISINTGVSPLEVARRKGHKEVVKLLEAAAAGLPLSPSLELEFRSAEMNKTELKIIGCSGGEVERQARNDESSDGGGPIIRLIYIT